MAGSMSQADLVVDLKLSMPGMDEIFTAAADADFIRHLDNAALDFGRLRPRRLLGEVTLVADQSTYSAPAGLQRFSHPLWGKKERRAREPWDSNWPGRLPCVSLIEGATGPELLLSPAPTAAQIADLGEDYPFLYYAAHVIDTDAASTTILPMDRGLLLLRAQAETMKELAVRNSRKPVSMRDGLAGSPKNGTPAALYAQLMESFEAQSR